MRNGDMRAGLELVKRSVKTAGRDGQSPVTEEDIMHSSIMNVQHKL
jgi:hypothetical protein